MLCETVFAHANLKLYKTQEHFDNGHSRASVVGHDEKNLCELKESVFILEHDFQNQVLYLLTDHC